MSGSAGFVKQHVPRANTTSLACRSLSGSNFPQVLRHALDNRSIEREETERHGNAIIRLDRCVHQHCANQIRNYKNLNGRCNRGLFGEELMVIKSLGEVARQRVASYRSRTDPLGFSISRRLWKKQAFNAVQCGRKNSRMTPPHFRNYPC